MYGVIPGPRRKRLLWLPRHVRVGRAVPVGIAFDQTVAGHVEIIFRIFMVRKSWRDKRVDKSAINADAIEDTQHISEFTCLHAFIAPILVIELQWHGTKI